MPPKKKESGGMNAAQAKELERKRQEQLLEQARQLQQQLREDRHLYSYRLLILQDTYKIFDSITKDIHKINLANERQSQWLRYADCHNTPHGQKATELRDYLYRWQRQALDDHTDGIDWLLFVNERSLLSQSPYRVDKTRVCLKRQQPSRANPLRRKFEESLRVLREVDEVLRQPFSYRLSPAMTDDIAGLRLALHEQFDASLDYLTFVVTGNVDRDMILEDELQAWYSYKSDVLSIGMYTNRDVPLPPPDPHKDGRLTLEFPEVNVKVACPVDMSFDGSVLRVVHFGYDHCSMFAASQHIEFPDADVIRRTLVDALRREGDQRDAMEREQLAAMKQKRLVYEQQLADEAEEATKGKNKKAPPAAKSAKPAKIKKSVEPPVVYDGMLLDMQAPLEQHEQAEHDARIAALQPAAALRLHADELNLREYHMLNGTYAFHYLERPAQSRKFEAQLFQRTFEQPDRLRHRAHWTPYRPAEPIAVPSDVSVDSVERATNAEEWERRVRVAERQWDALIEFSVTLPPNVLWWTRPRVVRWQRWEDSAEFAALSPAMQDYNLNYDSIIRERLERLFDHRVTSRHRRTKVVNDFDLANRELPYEPKLYYLMTTHIVPRLSQSYQFEAEVHEAEQKYAANVRALEHKRLEQLEDRMMRQREAAAELERQAELRAREEREAEEREALAAEQAAERAAEEAALAAEEAERAAKEGAALKEPEPAEPPVAPSRAARATERARKQAPAIYDADEQRVDEEEQEEELVDEETEIHFSLVEDEDEESLHFSSSAHENDEDEDMPSVHLVEQSKPASELFPIHPKPAPLVVLSAILPHIGAHPPKPLSTLLDEIAAINASEQPIFDMERRAGQLDDLTSMPESVADVEPEVAEPVHNTTTTKHRKRGKSLDTQQLRESTAEASRGEVSTIEASESRPSVAGRQSTGRPSMGRPSTGRNKSMARKNERPATAPLVDMLFAAEPATAAEVPEERLYLVPHNRGRWTSEGIHMVAWDPLLRTIKFRTTHLGTFGFAAVKYYNLPLSDWEMKPNHQEIPMSVRVALTGRDIRLELTVSPAGYRLFIQKPRLLIYPHVPSTERWYTLPELQALLRERNMDVFPDTDAMVYVQNGTDMQLLADEELPISYKFEPLVNHIYATLGYYCQTHAFRRSVWNGMAARREALLSVQKCLDERAAAAAGATADWQVVRVTPTAATCVRVEELCTELDKVQLRYHLQPAEQTEYTNFFDMLALAPNDKNKQREMTTDSRLRHNVIELFRAVNPLSFS